MITDQLSKISERSDSAVSLDAPLALRERGGG